MELRVKPVTLPEAIEFNFAELKQEITEKTEVYVGMVYTEDQIKNAKKDVAMLRKFTKALSDERIRVKKEILKPYEDFEEKVKELSGIVDKAIANIDSQIKIFDQIKQDEKKMHIEEMMANMLFPEFVTLEQVWNPKWLNATCSMNAIEAELLEKKNEIIRNCQTLATLPNYSHEALHFYQKTLDMAEALNKVREYAELEASKKEPEEKEEPVLATPAQNEEGKWIAFEACLTSESALKLKTFFETNNISFRPICKGE